MQKQEKQKTDGYIKNQIIRLKAMRRCILLKILCIIIPSVLLMAILWGIVCINPPPEKWKQKQIVFSHIAEERIIETGRETHVLYTVEDERYILGEGTKEAEFLSQQLVPNQEYSIVYCENGFTKTIESLSSSENEFIDLKKSIAGWENDHKILRIIIVIMICLTLIGSVANYVFWCKKERLEIKKTKLKIRTRLSKST